MNNDNSKFPFGLKFAHTLFLSHFSKASQDNGGVQVDVGFTYTDELNKIKPDCQFKSVLKKKYGYKNLNILSPQ